MTIFEQNLTYSDITNQIRSFIVSNNIGNTSLINEINTYGSNISTLIDIVGYVYLVSNMKNEMYFNEYSLSDATIPSNQIKRAMEYGTIIQSKKASKIKVALKSKNSDITVSNGVISIIPTSNPNLDFITELDTNEITFSSNDVVELEFKQIVKQTVLTFNVNTNYKSNTNYIDIPGKFDIDYDTFGITTTDGTECVKFDNTLDFSTYDATKIYYLMDFTGDNLRVIFLSGFIGTEYSGNVNITYNTTQGSNGNGYIDSGFKIKGTTLTGLNISDIQIFVQGNKTSNGQNEVDTNLLKYIAPTSFKSQQAIITKQDLINFFRLNYSGYNCLVLTSDDIIQNVTAGRIFVYLYKISNGNIISFDYNAEDWTTLYQKISLGSQIIFLDINEVNLKIDTTVMVSKSKNTSVVNNQIQNIIINHFNNTSFFTKSQISEKVLQSAIDGLSGFTINNITQYFTKSITTELNSNVFIYRLNSYNKPPQGTYESLIDNYFKDYTVIDKNNVVKTTELKDKLKFNFNNLTSDLLSYKRYDSFVTLPMPTNITLGNLINVTLKPLSKNLKNITIGLDFKLTQNIIQSVKSLSEKQSVAFEGQNITVTLSQSKLRKVTFNDSDEDCYFIDEDVIIELTDTSNNVYILSLMKNLDSTVENKKIVGFYSDINKYKSQVSYLVCNDNIKTQVFNLQQSDATPITLNVSLESIIINMNIENNVILNNDSVLLIKRSDIKNNIIKI